MRSPRFALLGYDCEGLFHVFQNPFYAGAHQAYRALGEGRPENHSRVSGGMGRHSICFKDEGDRMKEKRKIHPSFLILHPLKEGR